MSEANDNTHEIRYVQMKKTPIDEARERIEMLAENAFASGRYIIGVWRIEPDPIPGNNDRIFLDLEVQRWPTADFLPAVDLLKRRLSEIARDPRLRDPMETVAQRPVIDVQPEGNAGE